ncbi:MAG: translation elongation factor-like protein [Candidatus Eiseniibacteriota bacterium]|nr:MAG: translation elongation factor-like protein [Candidatus Eisenbacteria bacterium]
MKTVKEEKVGVVEHYFDKINVAAIKLTSGSLAVGDKIRIKGHTSDFEQAVESIQIEHDSVQKADKGADIGVKVSQKAREHDEVFKMVE